MRKLIPAIIMLLISAILVTTASYAWFSMNTTVSATSMQIEAVAEDGLLIINELDTDTAANWKVSTDASYGNLVLLTPTSSANMSDWYHNKSDDPTDAKAGQATATYETISADTNWKRDEGSGNSGAYYIDTDADDTKDSVEKAYVLLNKFYIKSSGNEISLGAGYTYPALYITKVVVTGASSTVELDASLRVAVKIGSEIFIYAPISGATTSYNVAGAASATTAIAVPANGIVNTATAQTSIPAFTEDKADTIEADIYVYFEGEDTECKTENLAATIDQLNVTVSFGIATAVAS